MTGVLGLALSGQGGSGGIEQLRRVWEEERNRDDHYNQTVGNGCNYDIGAAQDALGYVPLNG